jgi:hypothetical protein
VSVETKWSQRVTISIAAFLAIEEGGFSSTISLGYILCLRQFYWPLFCFFWFVSGFVVIDENVP